jgi:hypothetical protein
MNRSRVGTFALMLLAFGAGFWTHVLYLRWNSLAPSAGEKASQPDNSASAATHMAGFRVTFVPAPPGPAASPAVAELPPIAARDVERIRSLVGQQARIRGRVFRVGHSAKTNTYFVNFGPSREALTAVIFNSAVELFEKNKQSPRQFENREIEIVGQVKDHPQYGLEIILEHPKQIKTLN